MNLVWTPFCLCVMIVTGMLTSASTNSTSNISSKLEILRKLASSHTGEVLIKNVIDKHLARIKKKLVQLRIDARTELITLFPEFKPQIERLQKMTDECYDQTIGEKRINIFKDRIENVILTFLKSDKHVLHQIATGDIKKHISAFIQNLRTLTKLILKCYQDKISGKSKNLTRLGVTSMMIYTPEEIENQILNKQLASEMSQVNTVMHRLTLAQANPLLSTLGIGICSAFPKSGETIPETFDWRDYGFVTPPVNQGRCNSCYVFSTTAALETQYMIAYNTTEQAKFSEQATLNCMLPPEYSSHTCNGGILADPLTRYMTHGVTLADNLPYTAPEIDECDEYPVAFKSDDFCLHDNLTDQELQLLIQRNGPAVVAINALSPTFPFLKSPYHDWCSTAVDHAVTIVGWDAQYWIIKNSWGSNWGIGGYLYLPRNENKCGVNTLFGQPWAKRNQRK